MNNLFRIILLMGLLCPYFIWSQNLIEGEYFYNSDPGQGNGVSFTLPNNADVTQTLNLSTVGLSEGFHQVGIRVKRADGLWSHYWQQTIFVSEPFVPLAVNFPDLVEGEYFFGQDPGQGNGTSFMTPVGPNITQTLNLSTVGLNPGFHEVGIRVKRNDGRWSQYWQQAVFVIDPTAASINFPDLVEGEYFFGQDPGQGNGTSFVTPVGDDITQTLTVSTANLAPGLHQVGIRVKRDDGRWSHYWQQSVFILDQTSVSINFPDLVEGEYFFGQDPGQGNGTSFLTPIGDDITQTLNISTANLAPGLHQVGIRVKRDDGRWSHYWQQSVFIIDQTSVSINFPDLVEGEYFFGQDPGQGNGTSFVTPVGDDITQTLNIVIPNLSPGFHQLGIRVKREDGRWGHYWQQTVYIFDAGSQATIFPDLVEGEYFFGQDPGQGNGVSFTVGPDTNIDELVSISTVGLNPGIHQYGVRVKRADGRWGHYWQKQVEIPSCVVTGTDVITACGSYTWIDGNTYTQSNFVSTFLIPQMPCDSLVTLNLTIVPNSIAPNAINALYDYCIGGSTILEIAGGSLSAGAQWEWFEGACGSTVIGTGTTIEVSPNTNTTYFVRASAGNTCAASACVSIDVDLPNTGTSLSVDGEDATCFVNQNGWVHFYNASGRLIASINSNGQNLGAVTATSYVNGTPYQTESCAEPTNPSFFQANLQRTFVITPELQPLSPVQVRLYVLDSEVAAYQIAANATTQNLQDDITNISQLNMTKVSGGIGSGDPTDFCANGGAAVYVLQDNSGDINSLSFNGFSGTSYLEFTIEDFSEFFPMTSGNNNSALPVELTHFATNCLGETVLIQWTTASELNASHYILQNSRDGFIWSDVTQIEASGTTNQVSNYSFEDRNVGALTYYRLVQVDNDGQEALYGPISVNCQFDKNSMRVYPNPTSDNFTVYIQTNENFVGAVVELLDMSGRVILSQGADLNNGSTMLNFDGKSIHAGTYMIRVYGENDKFTPIRVVKM